MSIRMKLANWLSGGDVATMKAEIKKNADDRDWWKSQADAMLEKMGRHQTALIRIYDTPCGPKANGTQRKIRRIAAHALWKE